MENESQISTAEKVGLSIIVFVVGIIGVLTVSFNVELSSYAGHGLNASLVNFVGGIIAMAIFLLFIELYQKASHHVLVNESDSNLEVHWWMFLGGGCGAFFVSVSVLFSAALGSLLYFVISVAGQVFASLLFDQFGLFHYARHPVTTNKFVGMALLIAGCLCIQGLESNSSQPAWVVVVYLVLGFLSGMAVPIQGGLNHYVALYLRSPWRSSLASFSIGALIMLVVVVVNGMLIETVDISKLASAPIYTYFSGVGSVVIVVTAILLPQRVEVSNFTVLTVAGQLVGSLVLDSQDAFGNQAKTPTTLRIIGVVLGVVGSIVIQISPSACVAFFKSKPSPSSAVPHHDDTHSLVATGIVPHHDDHSDINESHAQHAQHISIALSHTSPQDSVRHIEDAPAQNHDQIELSSQVPKPANAVDRKVL